jgi:DNA polymerase-3 subunit epsilon
MRHHDGDTRILTRFRPRLGESYVDPVPDVAILRGVYLDVETTGLDTETAEIIELAIVPFDFTAAGHVVNVDPGQSWGNDPGFPIPAEVTALTGITDAMVKGQSIDHAAVDAELGSATIVLAHHADFDRRMMERRYPSAVGNAWGCSHREVDWNGLFGAPCSKLGHLLIELLDEFGEGHRALADCHVGVHLLGAVTDDSGVTALGHLLASARKPTYRIWAEGAPFSLKDTLKLEREYKWHGGERGRAKCWYRDVRTDEDRAAEVAWLAPHGIRATVQRFTARERYSRRMDP